MNAALVSRTLSLIPERVARAQSGSLFDPNAQPTCAHPERITHLAQFLNWLGPLNPVTKEDLRVFGLLTAYGKPAMAAEIDDDADGDADLDADADAEVEMELTAPVEATLPPVVQTEHALG